MTLNATSPIDGSLTDGSRFCEWMKCGNFVGSRSQNTGWFKNAQSRMPSFVRNLVIDQGRQLQTESVRLLER
jgi:hypothetical protein